MPGQQNPEGDPEGRGSPRLAPTPLPSFSPFFLLVLNYAWWVRYPRLRLEGGRCMAAPSPMGVTQLRPLSRAGALRFQNPLSLCFGARSLAEATASRRGE